MKIRQLTLAFSLLSVLFFGSVKADYSQWLECCNYNAEFSVSYLYWGAQSDQLGFAIENVFLMDEDIVLPSNLPPGKLKTHRTNWDAGFRLEAAAFSKCAPIGYRIEYTQFRTTSHASADSNFNVPSVAVTTISALPDGQNPFLAADSARSRWNLRLWDYAFDVAYSNCCGCFTFRPYVGVFGANIQQRQKIRYTGIGSGDETVDALVERKTFFKGVGPRIGLEFFANICGNLNLITNAYTSFLFGKSRCESMIEVPQISNFNFMDFKQKIRRGRPMASGLVGLEWDDCFCNTKCSFSVSYEYQYWWNQWHSASNLIDNLLSGEGRWGDLSLHGVVLTGTVSF
jgi:hypothetical protein